MKTLEFDDLTKLWFSSDEHLGHDMIRKHCNRPFASVEEMDKTMIDNWNAVISEDDIVFILGDFCWRMGSQQIKWYTNRLVGRKILILGNHDKGKFTSGFEAIYDGFVNIKVQDPDGTDGREKGYQRITLCHYPMLSWYQSHRGAWQLFGHWHNTKVRDHGDEPEVSDYVKEEHLYMDRIRSNQYDVGVDGHDFSPVSYQQIKTTINGRNKRT